MIELYHGDCLKEHENIKDGSVDLILTDLPYGNMKGADLDGWNKNKTNWDNAINPKDIYEIANRILRKNGKMVLFSQEPYTTELITNQIANVPFCYRMIWKKDHFANSLIAKTAPVSYFEDVLVFYKKYDFEGLHPLRDYFSKVMEFIGKSKNEINEELGHRKAEHSFYVKSEIIKEIGSKADHVFRNGSSQFSLCTEQTYNELIEKFKIDKMDGFKSFEELNKINATFNATFNLWEGKAFKSNILEYSKDYDGLHPTQKPELLLQDLIKTYSNENDLVVDLTMGSGSTGMACKTTNRNFIGIEKEEKYFQIAKKRLQQNTLNNLFEQPEAVKQ